MRKLALCGFVALVVAGLYFWQSTPRIENPFGGDLCVAQIETSQIAQVGDVNTPAVWRIEQDTFENRVFLAKFVPHDSDRALVVARALGDGGMKSAKLTVTWRKSRETVNDVGWPVAMIESIEAVN